MQVAAQRRTNRDRTEQTRALLIAAARRMFVEKGYADASTPEVAAAASVTRGALYHHFTGKLALFRAVIEAEAEALTDAIETGSTDAPSAVDALVAGLDGYFDAMSVDGRTRLLLVDGPAVLGTAAMQEIDARSAARSLKVGLADGFAERGADRVPIDALARILSAAFDAAALAVADGADRDDYRTALAVLIRNLLRQP